MAVMSRPLTNWTLTDLPATLVVIGISFFVCSLLGTLLGFALPINIEYRTNHQYGVDDVRIVELQRRLDALAATQPGLKQARLSELTQVADGCGAPGLNLALSARGKWTTGADVYHDFVGKAGEIGLGRACGETSISTMPLRNVLYIHVVLALVVLQLIRRSREGHSTFGVSWSNWKPQLRATWAWGWGILSGVAATILYVAITQLLSLFGL